MAGRRNFSEEVLRCIRVGRHFEEKKNFRIASLPDSGRSCSGEEGFRKRSFAELGIAALLERRRLSEKILLRGRDRYCLSAEEFLRGD